LGLGVADSYGSMFSNGKLKTVDMGKKKQETAYLRANLEHQLKFCEKEEPMNLPDTTFAANSMPIVNRDNEFFENIKRKLHDVRADVGLSEQR
jgi:hypothetical protein